MTYGQRLHEKYPKEYNSWSAAFQRCSNKNIRGYSRYGGRGIKFCERWRKFENFLADMGPAPDGDSSIERIDNNGHYEPGNCKWASRVEQQNNKRNNTYFSYQGETKHLRLWCQEFGLKYDTIYGRLNRNPRIDGDALFSPPKFTRPPYRTRGWAPGK